MKRDEKLNKRKSKKLLVPFCQRKGRNFVATTCDCLSLAVSKTNPWKRLETYSCNYCNLNCPILPATLGKSLDNITFIIIKKFPGDTNFERTTQGGLLWLKLLSSQRIVRIIPQRETIQTVLLENYSQAITASNRTKARLANPNDIFHLKEYHKNLRSKQYIPGVVDTHPCPFCGETYHMNNATT